MHLPRNVSALRQVVARWRRAATSAPPPEPCTRCVLLSHTYDVDKGVYVARNVAYQDTLASCSDATPVAVAVGRAGFAPLLPVPGEPGYGLSELRASSLAPDSCFLSCTTLARIIWNTVMAQVTVPGRGTLSTFPAAAAPPPPQQQQQQPPLQQSAAQSVQKRLYLLDDSDHAHLEQLVHVGQLTPETAALIESLARDRTSPPSRLLSRLFAQLGMRDSFDDRHAVLSGIVHLKLYLDVMTNGAPLHNEAHRQFGLIDDYRQQDYLQKLRERTGPFFALHRAVQARALRLAPGDVLTVHYEMEYRRAVVDKRLARDPKTRGAGSSSSSSGKHSAQTGPLTTWVRLLEARSAPEHMTVTEFTQHLSDIPAAVQGRIVDLRLAQSEQERLAAYTRALKSSDPREMRAFVLGFSSADLVGAKSETLKISDAVTKGLLWHGEVKAPSSLHEPQQFYSNPLILGDLYYTRAVDVERFLVHGGGNKENDNTTTTTTTNDTASADVLSDTMPVGTLPVLHPATYAFVLGCCVHYTTTSLSHFRGTGNGDSMNQAAGSFTSRWWCVFSGARIKSPAEGRYFVAFFLWHPPVVCVVSENTWRSSNDLFSRIVAGSIGNVTRAPIGVNSNLEVDKRLCAYLATRPLVPSARAMASATVSRASENKNASGMRASNTAAATTTNLLPVKAEPDEVSSTPLPHWLSFYTSGQSTPLEEMTAVVDFNDDQEDGLRSNPWDVGTAVTPVTTLKPRESVESILARQKRKAPEIISVAAAAAAAAAAGAPYAEQTQSSRNADDDRDTEADVTYLSPPVAKRAKVAARAPTPAAAAAPPPPPLAPLHRDNYRAMDARERALSRNAIDLYDEERSSDDEEQYRKVDFENDDGPFEETDPGSMFPMHPGLFKPGYFYKASTRDVLSYFPAKVYGLRTKLDFDKDQDGTLTMTPTELLYVPECTLASRLVAAVFARLRQKTSDLSAVREAGAKCLQRVLDPKTDSDRDFADAVCDSAGTDKNPWFVAFCQTRTLLRLMFFPKAQVKICIREMEDEEDEDDDDDEDDGSGPSGKQRSSGKVKFPELLKNQQQRTDIRNLPWPRQDNGASEYIVKLLNESVLMSSNELLDAVYEAEDIVLADASTATHQLASLAALVKRETIVLLVALFDV